MRSAYDLLSGAAGVPPALLRVMELTRATDLLELAATVDDALERVTG